MGIYHQRTGELGNGAILGGPLPGQITPAALTGGSQVELIGLEADIHGLGRDAQEIGVEFLLIVEIQSGLG